MPALSTIPASTAGTAIILKIPEGGVDVDFIVLKHNYENSGRTLVLRKVLHSLQQWHTRSGIYHYDVSAIDTWLNGTYFNTLDSAIQQLIVAVNIPHCPNVNASRPTVTTLSRKVFLLSCKETGDTDTQRAIEGTALPYFSVRDDRIAYLNGTAKMWWTRTSYDTGSSSSETYAYHILTSGTISSLQYINSQQGARPAFTLPAALEVSQNQDGTYSISAGGKPQWVKVNGVWKQAKTKQKISGVFQDVTPWVNVNGVWQTT